LRFIPGFGIQGASAAGCTDGSRAEAKSIAASGRFITPHTVYAPDTFAKANWTAKLELRYSKERRCAWGLISNVNGFSNIWLDRSSNGGRTWEQLGRRSVHAYNYDTYTGVYDDAGKLIRACTDTAPNGVSTVVCTPWY
jgi:hypothetical protein